ncbi:hypothetical protein [uncultured Clostridium sp.]|uniref:hypothetical protein n=1 Tax=uncultured Clostridium sp. TaxID=59620 RepID=UPI0025CC4891|nr:hypothetical protein [uncultured Clostridium sp.]
MKTNFKRGMVKILVGIGVVSTVSLLNVTDRQVFGYVNKDVSYKRSVKINNNLIISLGMHGCDHEKLEEMQY